MKVKTPLGYPAVVIAAGPGIVWVRYLESPSTIKTNAFRPWQLEKI